MRVVINLPDEIGDRYVSEAESRELPVAAVLEDRLKSQECVRLDPRQRAIVVQQPELGVIEEKLGGGSLQSSQDLAKKVQRLAKIGFEGHEIRLTPGQLEELNYRAGRTGKTLSQMVEEAYRQFAENFFTLVP